MSNVKFVLDTAGLRNQVLQSQYMLDMVTNKAQSMANTEQHIKPFIGFDRAKAIIYPNTKENPE